MVDELSPGLPRCPYIHSPYAIVEDRQGFSSYGKKGQSQRAKELGTWRTQLTE